MSTSIAALANRAVNPAKLVLQIPDRRLGVQATSEYLNGMDKQRRNAIRYPSITEDAFKLQYMDHKLGLMMPVFAFFHVDRAPTIGLIYYYSYREGNHISGGFDPETSDGDSFAFFSKRHLIAYSRKKIEAKKGFDPKNWHQSISLSFTTSLQMIIPEHVVTKIVEEQKKNTFNRGIYIVADVAKRWKSKEHTTIVKQDPDPLVIGINMVNTRLRYYMIDKFDLTKVEDYLVQEFAVDPAPPPSGACK